MHPCPCRRCVTDDAPTCCRLPAVSFTSPSSLPPTRRRIYVAVAVSAYRTANFLPSTHVGAAITAAFAANLLPPTHCLCIQEAAAIAAFHAANFSRQRTLLPSSPLPSQIICSRRRTHTAAAVAFTSPQSSPPTAQLFFSCRRPHIISTIPFTCSHPRINPNAFYSHPTRSFIKNIPKNCSECTRAHRRCVFTSPSQLECNRCIKMYLICFFNYSGKSLHFPFLSL